MDKVELIPLAMVIPTKDNPRVIRKDDPKTKELANSIKARGLLQPVLVRPHPTKEGFYDLRAGERRYHAHKLLKAKEILAIVRDMDNDTALDVTITENLQREDLSPMEEARGVKSLLDTGRTALVIAQEIGKSAQWVLRRAKLADLAPGIIEKFEGGEIETSIGHLELIARFDHAIQLNLVDHMSDHLFEPRQFRRFEEELNKLTMLLNRAPWDFDDSTLCPEDGACSECTRQSSHHPGLFDDDMDPDALKGQNKCLDNECWNRKLSAHCAREDGRLREKYPNLIKVATENIPYTLKQDTLKGVLDRFDYSKVKKGTPGALPALVAYGNDTGKVIWVNPFRDADKPGKSGKSGSTAGTDGSADPAQQLAQKEAALELRRKAWCCEHVSKAIQPTTVKHSPLPVIGTIRQIEIIVRAANIFGTSSRREWANDKDWGDFRLVSIETGLNNLWDSICEVLIRRLRYNTTGTCQPHYEEAVEIALLCKLVESEQDLMSLAVEAIPEPKVFARLRREVSQAGEGN